MATISAHKGIFRYEECYYGGNPTDSRDSRLFDPFFTLEMIILGIPDGFMLCGELGIGFCQLLDSYTEI